MVAFGGDGTVNEAANGLVGSDTPLTCLPGGATNVYCRMLGIPNDVVDATEHLLALADTWRRAPGRPRPASTGGSSPSPPAWGSTRAWSSASTRNPRLKARFGPWYFAQSAIRTFLERYVVRPPRLEVDGRRARPTRRHRVRAERRRRTPTSRPGRSSSPRARSSTPATSRGGVLTRASPVDIPTVAFRALSKRVAVAQPPPGRAVQRRRGACASARSTAAPLPVQVDGDHISDEVEVRFTVEPHALRVIC